MDKQTAIDLLDNLLGMVEDNHESDYDTAIKMGIDAIKALPSVHPESTMGQLHADDQSTKTDVISRRAAINAMWKALHEYEDNTEKQFQESDELDIADWIVHRGFVQDMNDIDRQTILNLPSVQPESRREWYMHGYRDAQNAAMHESCTDCPLYDHDRHNCPRFNKVIPTAIRDAQTGDVARDIATIIENEKDMRVILANGQTGWIPVTERLPGDDEDVIVTCLYDSGNTPFIYTTIAWHLKGMWVCYNERCSSVIAWMPLPEPYEPQESEVKK